jgi:hypothetical protein
MKDKLQWILEHYVGPNNVRTIYDSENQSALIPTTERCRLMPQQPLQPGTQLWIIIF